MSKKNKNLGCAVELNSLCFGSGSLWLFFKNKKTAKKYVCTKEFWENYEYPKQAIFCNIFKNSDNIPITSNSLNTSETFLFPYKR